jgi:hypothetical protein
MGDPAVAKLYPSIRALMLKNYPEAEIPEQYDPSMREQYINPIAEAYGAPKKTAVVGKVLVEEATGKELYRAPEEVKRHLVTVPGPNGPMQRLATEEELAAGVPTYQKPEKREQTLAEKVAEEEALTAARARGTASVGGGKPPTEGERKTAGYFTSVKAGEEKATQFENDKSKDIEPGFFENLLPKAVPESVKDPDRKAYLQAQREFSRHLRPESGGEIRADEYLQDAITYFKQRGDSDELVKQKQEARKRVLAGLEAQGGRAITGPITVTAPNGAVYTFPDAEQAKAFKKAAGIP